MFLEQKTASLLKGKGGPPWILENGERHLRLKSLYLCVKSMVDELSLPVALEMNLSFSLSFLNLAQSFDSPNGRRGGRF
jgi:hypothetical protein